MSLYPMSLYPISLSALSAVPVDDDYEYEYPDAEDGTRHSYKALDNYSPKQTRISTVSHDRALDWIIFGGLCLARIHIK